MSPLREEKEVKRILSVEKMSLLHPLETGLVAGVVAAPVDVDLPESNEKMRVKTVAGSHTGLASLVVGILITFVIFIVIFSLYEIIKARLVLSETTSLIEEGVYPEEDIHKVKGVAQASYNVAISFFVISLVIAIFALPFLFYIYQRVN